MSEAALGIDTVFSLGPVVISTTVVTTWLIMLFVALFSYIINLQLRPEPGKVQIVIEGVVTAIRDTVQLAAPGHAGQIMPFIGGLWIYLVIANLIGLVPGMHSPTRDLSATAALAILVTALLGWFDEGIQALLPNRVYDVRDIGFNTLAGLLAVAASLVLARARRRG